jgi:hypothetical protein
MSSSVLQASYPSLCTPRIFDCGALPLRRRERSFASFREFANRHDFGSFAVVTALRFPAEIGTCALVGMARF